MNATTSRGIAEATPTAGRLVTTEEPFADDVTLVEGVKAGDHLAQYILVKRFGARVKGLIRAISWDLPAEDAQDVALEVFRRVIKGITGFDGTRAKFITWLYRITENTTREYVRKSKKLQERFGVEFDSYERITQATGVEPGVVQPAAEVNPPSGGNVVRVPLEHRIVRDAVERLSPTERRVIEQWSYDLANPAIEELLKMSNQAVRTALSRAKAHLRDAFYEICRERGIDPAGFSR